jgi:hypothetical protein
MRNYVTFGFPTAWIPVSEEDGILSVSGAIWFVDILRNIPNLSIEREPCQEDWGVAIFVRYSSLRFWIGLSFWEENKWLAHVHVASWFKRLRRSGRDGISHLTVDLHRALSAEVKVNGIAWHREEEMTLSSLVGANSPDTA